MSLTLTPPSSALLLPPPLCRHDVKTPTLTGYRLSCLIACSSNPRANPTKPHDRGQASLKKTPESLVLTKRLLLTHSCLCSEHLQPCSVLL